MILKSKYQKLDTLLLLLLSSPPSQLFEVGYLCSKHPLFPIFHISYAHTNRPYIILNSI